MERYQEILVREIQHKRGRRARSPGSWITKDIEKNGVVKAANFHNPEEEIEVYATQLVGLNGPIIYGNMAGVLEEIKQNMEHGEPDECMIIDKRKMTRKEFAKLKDFEGY